MEQRFFFLFQIDFKYGLIKNTPQCWVVFQKDPVGVAQLLVWIYNEVWVDWISGSSSK